MRWVLIFSEVYSDSHIHQVARDPNLIVKLSRMDEWAEDYPDVMGPRNAYFYFGPYNSPGRLAYGGGAPNSMLLFCRKKKDSSG